MIPENQKSFSWAFVRVNNKLIVRFSFSKIYSTSVPIIPNNNVYTILLLLSQALTQPFLKKNKIKSNLRNNLLKYLNKTFRGTEAFSVI